MTTRPLSPLQQAYQALELARKRIHELEAGRRARVAIIGIGCRFPGGVEGPRQFWEALIAGRDLVTRERSGLVQEWRRRNGDVALDEGALLGAGFIENVFDFDAAHFGISPREAQTLDPQQRHVLEVSLRALEDACIGLPDLKGRKVGIFIGAGANEYHAHCFSNAAENDFGYIPTGNALNAIAGRLAHSLGTRGPTLVVDTACSSSLVALHLAVRSLQAGECELALVGGVNVLLNPMTFSSLARANMLSPDGACRAFDGRANGYVRSEGCGIVVLSPESQANRSGHRVYAIIRGSAISHDGTASSLSAPNGSAQQAVIRDALSNGGVSPGAVQFIETHGTGTALGDPIELQAVEAVYGQGRSAESPLVVGALKTNLGHMESASGIGGLIKVALSLEKRTIPPSIHFREWNPALRVSLDELQMVTGSAIPWRNGATRLGAVSSFGFTGTNAHVVLEESRATNAPQAPRTVARVPQLFTLSARDQGSLRQSAADLLRHLDGAGEHDLQDLCLSSLLTRGHLPTRVAWRVGSLAELKDALQRLASSEPSPERSRKATRPAFIFSSAGPAASGSALEEALPAFAEIAGGYRELANQALDWTTSRPDAEQSDRVQRLVFQLSLADLLTRVGVLPACVVGGGRDTLAAAVFSGSVRFANALPLLSASPEESAHELARLCGEPSVPMVSSGDGTSHPGQPTVDTWRRLLGGDGEPGPAAIAAMTASGHDAGILVGPVVELRSFTEATPSSRDGAEESWSALLGLLGRLYEQGHPIAWRQLFSGITFNRIPLHPYPLKRKTFRIGGFDPVQSYRRPERPADVPGRGALDLSDSALSFVSEHRVFGTVVVPGAFWLAAAVARGSTGRGAQRLVVRNVSFHEALPLTDTSRPLPIAVDDEPRTGQARGLRFKSKSTDAISRDGQKLHCSSEIELVSSLEPTADDVPTEPRPATLAHEEFYAHMQQATGISHEPSFRWVRQASFGSSTGVAALQAPEHLGPPGGMAWLTTLLDSTLQVLGVTALRALAHVGVDGLSAIPFSVDEIRLYAPLEGRTFECRAHLTQLKQGDSSAIGNVSLFGERGERVADLVGISFRKIPQTLLSRFLGKDPSTRARVYQRTLDPEAIEEPAAASRPFGRVILAGARGPAMGALQDRLQTRGIGTTVIEIPPAGAWTVEHVREALLPQLGNGAPARVLYVGRGTTLDLSTSTSDIHAAYLGSVTALSTFLQAMQGIFTTQRAAIERLAVVFAGDGSAAASTAAPLEAFTRAFRREHGEPPLSILGLDSAPASLEIAVRALIQPRPGADLLVRAGVAYSPRWRPVSPPPRPAWSAGEIRGGNFIITGGLGSLGLHTARWLAKRGASTLHLVGRNGANGSAEAALAELRARGVRVETHRIDLGDAEAVAALFSAAAHAGPLAGVIHAAGALCDMPVAAMDETGIETPALSKVRGTLNLLAQRSAWKPGIFIAYSSASAAFGNPGQSSYAAANAFMDEAVLAARQQGSRAFSVQWGPWSDSAMLSQAPARHIQTMERAGISQMETADAFEALELQLASDEGVALVGALDWTKLAPEPTASATSPAPAPTQAGADQALLERLRALDDDERLARIGALLRERLAVVLQVDDAASLRMDENLFDMGVDSLATLSLRDEIATVFGIELPTTVLLNQATLAGVAEHIAGELRAAVPQALPRGATADAPRPAAPPEDALLEELKAFEAMLEESA